MPTIEAYRTVVGAELKNVLFCIAGILIAFAWSKHEKFKWSASWMILIILSVELYNVDMKAGSMRQNVYAAITPSLKWLMEHSKNGRVLGLKGIYAADTLVPYRIRDIRHMDAMYPKLYVDFAEAVWPDARSTVYTPANPTWQSYDSKLLNLAAVRYVLSTSPLEVDSTTMIDSVLHDGKITTFDKRLVNGTSSFDINGFRRRVLFEHPPSTIEYKVRIPTSGELFFSIGEEPSAWTMNGDGTIFEVAVGETLSSAHVRYQRFYNPKHNAADRRWVEGKVDLSDYAGQTTNLYLITKPGLNGSGNNAYGWDGWANLHWGPDRFTEAYCDVDTCIYRNNDAMDRARFVPFYRVADQSFRPSDLKSANFDVRREVYLKGYSKSDKSSCSADATSRASVKNLQDDPDIMQFSITAPCEGFFVLADLDYPGWEARVDGRSVSILNANYAFRAVPLSAGRHEVTFRYAPWTITMGMPIACLTLVISSLLFSIKPSQSLFGLNFN